MKVFFLLLVIPLYLQAEPGPWGKDADLTIQKEAVCVVHNAPTPLKSLAEVLIGFHQNVISPCDGPRSHFIPSSSQYTLDAVRKYGFFKGVSMGCDRLMRENDAEWVYRYTVDGAGQPIKWDPVP